MNSSDRYAQQHEEYNTVPYRPQHVPTREKDIITICSYTWSQIGHHVRYTFGVNEIVYTLAADFVDNHQLPNAEYGVGEGKEMDWDEHVENFMLKKLQNQGFI
jgi:hypothetical protein